MKKYTFNSVIVIFKYKLALDIKSQTRYSLCLSNRSMNSYFHMTEGYIKQNEEFYIFCHGYEIKIVSV